MCENCRWMENFIIGWGEMRSQRALRGHPDHDGGGDRRRHCTNCRCRLQSSKCCQTITRTREIKIPPNCTSIAADYWWYHGEHDGADGARRGPCTPCCTVPQITNTFNPTEMMHSHTFLRRFNAESPPSGRWRAPRGCYPAAPPARPAHSSHKTNRLPAARQCSGHNTPYATKICTENTEHYL